MEHSVLAWRSALTVGSRHECACHAHFGPHAQRAIQFNPDQNHLLKWIGINLDRIWIGRMCIQCERAQTEFDPVQCALGVQCEQAFSYCVVSVVAM